MQQIKANHPRWKKSTETKKNIKRQSRNSTLYSTSTSIYRNIFATTDTWFTSPRDSREPPFQSFEKHEVFPVTSINPTLAQPGKSSVSCRDRAAIGSIKSLWLVINVNSSPPSIANPKNWYLYKVDEFIPYHETMGVFNPSKYVNGKDVGIWQPKHSYPLGFDNILCGPLLLSNLLFFIDGIWKKSIFDLASQDLLWDKDMPNCCKIPSIDFIILQRCSKIWT